MNCSQLRRKTLFSQSLITISNSTNQCLIQCKSQKSFLFVPNDHIEDLKLFFERLVVCRWRIWGALKVALGQVRSLVTSINRFKLVTFSKHLLPGCGACLAPISLEDIEGGPLEGVYAPDFCACCLSERQKRLRLQRRKFM